MEHKSDLNSVLKRLASAWKPKTKTSYGTPPSSPNGPMVDSLSSMKKQQDLCKEKNAICRSSLVFGANDYVVVMSNGEILVGGQKYVPAVWKEMYFDVKNGNNGV